MFTWRFWREAFERGIKSSAQAVVLTLGGGKAFDLLQVDYKVLLGAAAGGFLLSILTSLISLPIGADDSPSAIK